MRLRSVGSAILAVAAVLLAATGVLPTTAHAQRGDLVRIGAADVPLDKGPVTVDVSGARGSFGEVRIYNRGAPIVLDTVRIIYSDGSFHDERRPIDLRKGERTRPIDGDRGDKFIDKVVFFYKPTKGSKDVANLQVYAMQDRRGARAERPVKKNIVIIKPEPDKKPGKRDDDRPVAPPTAKPAAPAAPAKTAIQSSKAPTDGRCVGEGNLLIARGNVGFGVDRDRLKVGGNLGKFDKIRLCVKDNDVDLIDLKVNFVSGKPVELAYEGLIKAGYRSQPMGLKGDRFIDNIEIAYKKRADFTGRATVEVWGEIAEKWIDEEAELYNEGWVKLTTGDTVGFVGFERDSSPVRPHKRGFRDVRVVVRDRDITLDYVELIFADGKSQKIDGGRKRIEPNVGFGPIKVEGGPKVIKTIEARYRSRFFDKDAKGTERATVEIWAKR